MFLETGMGDDGVEVDTLEKRVNLNGGLSSRGEGTLETLANSTETTESTSVDEALLVLALEFVDEVVDKTVVKAFTKVSVTNDGFNLKDTMLKG